MEDNKCTCNVCGRRFDYGDEWSPMLNNEAWNQVVAFYGLTNFEKQAEKRFYKAYDAWARRGYPRETTLNNVNLHTFICYKCMEKALGRRLTEEDLIAKDVLLNKEFEKKYFRNI